MHEGVCLNCTLIAPQCDGNDAGCRFVAITRGKRNARERRLRRRSRENEQIKSDIIAILGKLIGEKAIDQARAAAQI